MTQLTPHWTVTDARVFAESMRRDHDPIRQTMSDGKTPNPHDRCALCGYTRYPCDVYDMAALLLVALDEIQSDNSKMFNPQP